MFVITDCLCLDAEMIQEHSRPPRIFAGHDVNFAQDAQRALGDVFQIADRRGDDVESAGHVVEALWHCEHDEQKPRSLREEAAGPLSVCIVGGPLVRATSRNYWLSGLT